MKKILFIVTIFFSVNSCFSMNEEEKADLKQRFSKIMSTITDSHSTIDSKIKDPNFPLQPLIDCLNLHRKTLEENRGLAFHVDQSKVNEIDQLHSDTCKKLTALTLLQKQHARKSNKIMYHCMGLTSMFVALVYTPFGIYLNEEFQINMALPFFTLSATLGAFFHGRRAHQKAQPKPMLSDALKEVLPHLHESEFNELKWLKPDLIDDSYVSKCIRGMEAERKALNAIANMNMPGTQKKIEALAKPEPKFLKLLYNEARYTRNINALVRLASMLDPKLNTLAQTSQDKDQKS